MVYETSDGKQLKLPVVPISTIDKKDEGCVLCQACPACVLSLTRHPRCWQDA